MIAPELKPCPFCGGEAAAVPDPSHSTGWDIGCFSGSCEIEPHVWAVHKSTAEMQWNTRTDTIPSDPRVKALVLAATAVVNRWHQPTWKDAGPTGQFIGELEAALAALKGASNE